MERKKVTVAAIKRKKKEGKKITALTAYDFFTAGVLDEAGIDIILVGDSLAQVVLGHENTLKVTMEEMLHHTKAVALGSKDTLVIADMPFLSYAVSLEDTIRNAGRFIKEAGADAVKLEGGLKISRQIRALVEANIPVLGHVGLTPQDILNLGSYKVQGKDKESYEKVLLDAQAVKESGAFAIVLECVPQGLAKEITETIDIPTIGIGAGVDCDGQILVSHDILGLSKGHKPKFVKKYADIQRIMQDACLKFKEEVEAKKYPDSKHSY